MSDPTPDQQPGTPPTEAQNPPAEPMIPKSRFDEINTKLRKLEADAAKRDADQRAAAEQAAAAKGEFEKLATERGARLAQIEADNATLAERHTALVELIEKQARGRIQALPDEIRAMKPDGDVVVLLDWLGKAEAAAAKLNAQRTPGTPPGPRGAGGVTPAAPVDIRAAKATSLDYSL